MRLNTTNKQYVDEKPYGVYVWKMPDGSYVGDDDGHFLMIASLRGNRERVEKLQAAARAYGVEGGQPWFLSGHRVVSDEEYEEQKQRLKWGLVPDPMDVPAFEDAKKHDGK